MYLGKLLLQWIISVLTYCRNNYSKHYFACLNRKIFLENMVWKFSNESFHSLYYYHATVRLLFIILNILLYLLHLIILYGVVFVINFKSIRWYAWYKLEEYISLEWSLSVSTSTAFPRGETASRVKILKTMLVTSGPTSFPLSRRSCGSFASWRELRD